MARFVPTKVYHEFKKFLDEEQIKETFYYTVDEEGSEKLSRHVVEKSKRDLKATISLFEKLYPEWFDPLTVKKLNSSEGDEQTIGEVLRSAFALKYPDTDNPDKKNEDKNTESAPDKEGDKK